MEAAPKLSRLWISTAADLRIHLQPRVGLMVINIPLRPLSHALLPHLSSLAIH